MNAHRHSIIAVTAVALFAFAPVGIAAAAESSSSSGVVSSAAVTDSSSSGATSSSSTGSSSSTSTSSSSSSTTDSSSTPPTTTTSTTPPSTETHDSTPPPTTEIPETPQVVVPKTPEVVAPDVVTPTVKGGGQLPFTGPGDVLLAMLIALIAGTGGVLLLLGATSREQIDGLSKRTLASASGFRVAYRELLKRQTQE